MNPETLDKAAFWHQVVCLDCEAVFDEEEICPSCGSDAVYSAEFIQKVAAWANSD